MNGKLRACRNCRWFGLIDSYFLTYGMCRKHMKTVHMNFVCEVGATMEDAGRRRVKSSIIPAGNFLPLEHPHVNDYVPDAGSVALDY